MEAMIFPDSRHPVTELELAIPGTCQKTGLVILSYPRLPSSIVTPLRREMASIMMIQLWRDSPWLAKAIYAECNVIHRCFPRRFPRGYRTVEETQKKRGCRRKILLVILPND